MAVSPSRRQFVPLAVSKWQSLSAEDSLLTFLQQGLQMAVSPSRRQFVSPAVSKWQSLSAEDSLLAFSQQGLQMAVSFSRRQFDSLASQQMAVSFSRRQFAHFHLAGSTNGSLSQQKTVCSPSNWQMAVFSQEKTVCLLNTQRDRQMAVSSNSLSVSGMFSSPQSRRMAVFPLGKQFVDSPGTSRRMAVFTLKTVRPPSNKVISPSKERGPT